MDTYSSYMIMLLMATFIVFCIQEHNTSDRTFKRWQTNLKIANKLLRIAQTLYKRQMSSLLGRWWKLSRNRRRDSLHSLKKKRVLLIPYFF